MLQSEEDQHIRSEFFYPSLWKQRRNFIQDILVKYQIETVLDYGCGEASVLSFLISPEATNITKMAGIDLDLEVLVEAIDRCMPLKTDFERKRRRPLTIDIFHGSIGVVDDRLKGNQAIVCSEVIEHLFQDTLEPFLDITLGIYQPEILLVTTPNGEYNINFPNLKYGTKQSIFRHDDHKFEWTRDEFETWCKLGAEKYNYDIEFYGIGLLHGKYDDIENGHCTQACVFIRSDKIPLVEKQCHGTPHKLLSHIEFPYHEQKSLTKEEIIDEVLYYIESLCRSEYYARCEGPATIVDDSDINVDFEATIDWSNFSISEYNMSIDSQDFKLPSKYTPAPFHIPVSSLWEITRIQEICSDQSKLKNILSLLNSNDFKLEDNDLVVYKIFKIEPEESVSSIDSDNEQNL